MLYSDFFNGEREKRRRLFGKFPSSSQLTEIEVDCSSELDAPILVSSFYPTHKSYKIVPIPETRGDSRTRRQELSGLFICDIVSTYIKHIFLFVAFCSFFPQG